MARVYDRSNRRGQKVWYIDYSAVNPKTGLPERKRERVGYSKREAEEALQSRLTDIRRERFDNIFPEGTCTLEEIWPRYRAHSKAMKSQGQVEREKGIYEKHLVPAFGSYSLNRITADQVEQYQIDRLPAVSSAAAAAAVSSTTAAATTRAAATRLTRFGFINGERPAFHVSLIQLLNGFFSLGLRAHLDKTKSLRPPRHSIRDYTG